MAKEPQETRVLAGIGMITATPTKLRFPEGEVRIHLRSAVNSIKNGSPSVQRTHVLIERIDESPLDLGAQAVQLTPRGGDTVVVSYSQFANLFS
jgi:hypothetical protein